MFYPNWIDDYAESSYELFAGNILEAFQPLDFYHFYPLWYVLWLDKIYEVIQKIKKNNISLDNIINKFPPLTSVRAGILLKLVTTFPHLQEKDVEKFRLVVNFLLEVIKKQSVGKIFAEHLVHTPTDIKKILEITNWQKSTKEVARNLGQLSMSAGNLVNSLYDDVVTDMGWVASGPYDVSEKFRSGATLVIREFPELKPTELWPDNKEVQELKYKELKILNVYQNLKCHIGFISMHTTYDKSAVDTMINHAVIVDGTPIEDMEEIKKIIQYFGSESIKHFSQVKELDFEQLKQKVIEQENYQLHTLFEYLSMDWRPSDEMKERVKGKKLLTGLYTQGRIINFAEYCQEFGINYLKDVYSN